MRSNKQKVRGRQVSRLYLDSKTEKAASLSPEQLEQGYSANKDVIIHFGFALTTKLNIQGEFLQNPFFVSFCPFFFYVFASLRTSTSFFIRILVGPYPHQPNCHILDKSCAKKIFCKGYSLILKYRSFRSYTKFLSKCNCLLSADMDLQKCGRKSAYFFKEKQKRKKTDKNGRKTDTE